MVLQKINNFKIHFSNKKLKFPVAANVYKKNYCFHEPANRIPDYFMLLISNVSPKASWQKVWHNLLLFFC